MWRIFRRRQDAVIGEVLARLEALEGRAGRQDRRVDSAYEAFGSFFARAGVSAPELLEDTMPLPALLCAVPQTPRRSA